MRCSRQAFRQLRLYLETTLVTLPLKSLHPLDLGAQIVITLDIFIRDCCPWDDMTIEVGPYGPR